MLDLYDSLLDQITIVHGPHELLHRYFVVADEIARRAGVRIRIHSDFRRLMELNRRHQSSWKPMQPAFDPAHSRLRPDASFWVEAVDDTGMTVATHAQRLFVWPSTTLEEEVCSLRLFYADPEPHIAAGESMVITAPIGKRMTGRAMFGGALWTHPDWRRRGLVRIVPRIARAYGYTRWAPDYIFAFVEAKLAGIVPHASGPYTVEPGLISRISFREDFPAVIMWMTADRMLWDMIALITQETTERERLMEMPRTNSSPDFLDHGMSARS
ncbi:MAG TPA: hypothetical protein VEI03_03660 [Stellaceae bacterium]|nr:hypothetical protein [Stellaceae bacterium]